MASKQLGKLRQWAGEVISSRDKSTVTDEFRELEIDVELRKEGLLRLQFASEAYHHALSKKKDFPALDQSKEKLLPLDALGLIMQGHGEEFGEDSAFGTSLVKLGEAHSKVAMLQEAYALTFQDTFLASMKNFGEDIKDYEHQRKKLESRRLSYDAAISKLEKVKSSKKENDRKEAEDELQTARLRYEETSEDVRARARGIQENEIQQLRDLTGFLDVEVNFVQQYLEVLQDVKSNWCDASTLSPLDIPRANGPTHIFPRATDDTTSNSGHSKKSAKSSRSNVVDTSDSSSDESTGTANRKGSKHRRSRSGSGPSSRPPSRPASRASRIRADSGATTGGMEKEKSGSGGRMSVAGWASSAVSSVTGRGKKDRDKFATLTDDFDSDSGGGDLKHSSSSTSFTKHLRSKSKDSLANASPKIPLRIMKPHSLLEKKLVRALYDFAGSTDELTFKAGDEIVVLNEVLDGWWMGELDGHKGLFPTPYIEVISSPPGKPPVSYRPERIGTSSSAADDSSVQSSLDVDGYVSSDIGDNHVFGDPLVAIGRSPLYGNFDAESVTDSAVEEDEGKRLMPTSQYYDDDDHDNHAQRRTVSQPSRPPIVPRRSIPNLVTTQASPSKKSPPPPPPRRSTTNVLAPPPIPQRGPSAVRSRSSGSLHSSSPHSSSVSSLGHDVSPFESATEIAMTSCQNFRQNPFKPLGMCSNCLQVHF